MKFDYHQPDSLPEAIDLLTGYEANGSEAALLAGGTALLLDMKNGQRSPGHLVSLWGIPNLAKIQMPMQNHKQSQTRRETHIGALATISELAEAIETTKNQPALSGLVEAARQVGGLQVQNMATVGGNICHASPGADLVPPLLCLDATLTVVGPEGERRPVLDGFLTGPDQTALRPGEIVSRISLPPPAPRTGASFYKMMRRQAIDCSIVAAAARISLAEDGRTCQTVRIAVGAAGPTPFRAKEAEAALTGQVIEPESVQAAAQLAREESQPIDDVRASADYRRLLVNTLVERALWRAFNRATQGGMS